MFIYSFRCKWWRVVSFVLLLVIVIVGIYYLMNPLENRMSDDMLPTKEAQVWQV